MKTFAEIIQFFEEHDNRVSKKILVEELGFKPWHFIHDMNIKRYAPQIIRIEKGIYGLNPDILKKFSISLPEGTLRLDRQTFIPNPGVSQAEIEAAVVARVTKRAAQDHLLLKDIKFSGNRYDLSFYSGRYSKPNNHVVFDSVVEHPKGNFWRADAWDRQGRWELGTYFRSLKTPTPAEYPNVVAEVMSVIHSRHGDPGRILQLSEGNYHIKPITMSSEAEFFSKGRFDPVSKTYQFNQTFLQAGSDTQYKNKFMDTMDDLKLSSKRFLSITFKRALSWAGLALSVNQIASANDKVDAATEEAYSFGGGLVGSATGLALTGTTGPLGWVAALLYGAIGSESMVQTYRAVRYYRTSGQNTVSNSSSTDKEVYNTPIPFSSPAESKVVNPSVSGVNALASKIFGPNQGQALNQHQNGITAPKIPDYPNAAQSIEQKANVAVIPHISLAKSTFNKPEIKQQPQANPPRSDHAEISDLASQIFGPNLSQQASSSNQPKTSTVSSKILTNATSVYQDVAVSLEQQTNVSVLPYEISSLKNITKNKNMPGFTTPTPYPLGNNDLDDSDYDSEADVQPGWRNNPHPYGSEAYWDYGYAQLEKEQEAQTAFLIHAMGPYFRRI